MPFTLTVDGGSVSPTAPGSVGGGVRLSWEQGGVSSLAFALTTTTSGTFASPVDVGDPVVLTETGTGDKLFGGFVQRITASEVTHNPDSTYTILQRIQCVDNSHIARRRLVSSVVYTNDAFEDIVDDLVTNYLTEEGVTQTNVATGPTLNKVIFGYRTVADALDELCEAVGYSWYIDADKDLHCYKYGDTAASLSFTSGDRDFRTLQIQDTLEQYANSVIVRGGQGITNARAETLVGDGTRRVFNVAFPLAEKPSAITAAAVSIAAGDIGIRGLDTGKKWYWSKGSHELEQDSSETVLSSVQTVEVTYKGLFPIIVQSQDTAEITARAAASSGTSGKYERVEVDASIEDTDLAADKASGILRRYGRVPVRVQFTTDDQTCRPGQTMLINLPEYGVNDQFLIERVSATDRGDGEFVFSVNVVSGEAMQSWQEWWRSLTRKDKIQVGDEYVVRLEAATETVTVSATESVDSTFGAPWHTLDVTQYGFSSLFRELPADIGDAIYDVNQYSDGSQWS